MSQVSISPGGSPVPSGTTVATDQVTIRGSGSEQDPLRLADGSGGSVTANFAGTHPAALGLAVVISTSAPSTEPTLVTPGTATSVASALIAGIIIAIPSASVVKTQSAGSVTLTTAQWDAIAGTSGGLVRGDAYYLTTDVNRGFLSSTAPSAGGTFKSQVGIALNATTLLLSLPAVPVAN